MSRGGLGPHGMTHPAATKMKKIKQRETRTIGFMIFKRSSLFSVFRHALQEVGMGQGGYVFMPGPSP